ncbi:protein of unknown function [Burkholderia multivorans]
MTIKHRTGAQCIGCDADRADAPGTRNVRMKRQNFLFDSELQRIRPRGEIALHLYTAIPARVKDSHDIIQAENVTKRKTPITAQNSQYSPHRRSTAQSVRNDVFKASTPPHQPIYRIGIHVFHHFRHAT